INRFNLFTSIPVNATINSGYTTGEAINAITETAAKLLPQGYSYEYSGMTREQASESESATAVIFGLCLAFVFLILSAQYESYVLPLAVILSVPLGLMGTFLFAQLFGISNNIYLKISLIMLIGLLAKNAILIVEFAVDRRRTGMSLVGAAVAGAAARLRPILMTSLAMIIGLLPLMFASGVGANGNNALGVGAIGGMLVGTVLQVLIVPCLFVVFQGIQEKIKPIKWSDTQNEAMSNELQQYTK
ncbi:MAG: efflux RND transporter permease subunit, partial [Muribaculaceae bacterium]